MDLGEVGSHLNAQKSVAGFDRIQERRAQELVHLRLCRQLCAFQVRHGRQSHLEQPLGSSLIFQDDFECIRRHTKQAKLDMCAFGLKIPHTNRYLRKSSQLWTTDDELHNALDGRKCPQNHEHQAIAGRMPSIKAQSSTEDQPRNQNVTQFCATYCKGFAHFIAEHVCQSQQAYVNESLKRSISEPNPSKLGRFATGLHKRRRMCHSPMVESPDVSSTEVPHDSLWYEVFKMANRITPRVGNQRHLPETDFYQLVSGLLPSDTRIHGLFTCRGTDRYQVPLNAPSSHEAPWRHTICMNRQSGKIHDFQPEHWHPMTRAQRIRKCMASRMTLTMFLHRTSDGSRGHPAPQQGVSDLQGSPQFLPEVPNQQHESLPVESTGALLPRSPQFCEGWAPPPTPLHGPAFRNLKADEKNQLVKLHTNLGHPDPEVLAMHLKFQGSPQHIIAAAKEYVCDSCVETKKPYHQRPAKLHDPKEFNQVIGMDGFYWTGHSQFQSYVIHVYDEASGFHMARRLDGRNIDHVIPGFRDMWLSWAGPPESMYLDPAGEFRSDQWSQFLQSQNIDVFMSTEAWQKGRIERHGDILKNMLTRMDQENPFQTPSQFDEALLMCCRAKNSLSRSHGYAPEQIVLGKSSKLPASLTGDPLAPAHALAIGEGLESENFRKTLDLRTRARQAYILADNSDAMRRALLRKSCPHRGTYQPGQLVLYWVRRRKPNRSEVGRWHGPGRVVIQEGSSVVWISHLDQLLRCAPESVRPASLREWQSAHGSDTSLAPENFNNPDDSRLNRALRDHMNNPMDNPPDVDSMVPSPSTPGAQSVGVPSLNSGEQPEREATPRNNEESSNLDPNVAATNSEDTSAPVPGEPDMPAEPVDDGELQEMGLVTQVVSLNSHDAYQQEETVLHSVDVFHSGQETNQVCLAEDDLPFIDDPLVCSPEQCFALEIPLSANDVFNWYQESNPEEMVCVASASQRAHAEVHVKNMTSQERQLFEEAKNQELNCWISTNSLRPVLRKHLNPNQILQSRWVLTWKQIPAEDDRPATRKAKARLVVLGYQDPQITKVARDAPALTRDGRHSVLQAIASYHWELTSFDIKTAFLRGKADEANPLAMNPPSELRRKLQLSDDQVCELVGNAYGRVDAPLLFYKELTRHLKNLNFRVHPLEPCVFILESWKAGQSILHGIIGTHVDDGIAGGDGYFHAQLNKLQEKLPFGSFKQRSFTFCGIQLEQTPDFSIQASQSEYVHKIQAIDVGKHRREQPQMPTSEVELSKLRGLVGSLQYAVSHTRPDLAARLGEIQVQMAQPKVETLLACNKVLREAQQTAQVKICFRSILPQEVTHVSFGDASFASPKQLASFQGTLICATTKALDQNQQAPISPLSWSSKKIARVVRSTLSAEAYSMSRSVDRLSWLRLLWGVIHVDGFKWQDPHQALHQLPKAVITTDCKSLYDLVSRLAMPSCEEYRTTLEVLLIKERCSEHCSFRWIPTSLMLADPLTKPMDPSVLRAALATGLFQIYDEASVLRENAHRKCAVSWLNNQVSQSCPESKQQKLLGV